MKKIIIILCIILMAFNVDANDYYVCPASESGEYQGNDSNDGTLGYPVATISRALAVSGNGDNVYFCSQGTWTGNIPVLSAEAGVKYYGASWGTGTRAKIIPTNNMDWQYIAVIKACQSNVVIDGFEVDADNYKVYGIAACDGMTGNLTTIKINNNVVHDNGPVPSGDCDNGSEQCWMYGIYAAARGGYTISNLEVTNNTVYNTYHEGIAVYSSWNTENNVTDTILVRGNHVYNAGTSTIAPGAGVGLEICNEVKDATVEFNYIHDNNGQGIYVRNSPVYEAGSVTVPITNLIVRYNIIHDNDVGISLANPNEEVITAAIYSNILYNNGIYIAASGNGSGGGYPSWENSVLRFYNNTILSATPSVDPYGVFTIAPYTNEISNLTVHLNNNIIHSSGSYRAIHDHFGVIGSNHSNNLIYTSNNPAVTTTSSYTLAEVLSTWEATAVITSPAFTGGTLPTGFSGTYGTNMVPNTDYFQLTVDSPAKDTGATLASYTGAINGAGLTTPIVRPLGAAFDIGAYEYGSVAQSGGSAGSGFKISGGTILGASASSATVGWTDYSVQTTDLTGSRLYCYGPFATSGSGSATVSKISIYNETASETVDMKLGLYADSTGVPGTIVGSETEFANFGDIGGEGLPAGWHDYTVNYSITLGSSYHICLDVSASSVVYTYGDGGTEGTNMNYMASAYAEAWPASFTSEGTGTAQRAVTMYYTW